MKKSRFFVLILALLTLALCLADCGETETTVTPPEGTLEDSQSEESSEDLPPEEPPEKLTSWQIGENDIAQYTIIYAQSEFYNRARIAQFRPYFPVYNFNEETANRLADLIYNYIGVRLEVKEDKSTAETEKEILVGMTNRAQTQALTFAEDSYQLAVQDGKLIVCGDVYGTTWHSLDALEKLICEELSDFSTVFRMKEGYCYQGQHHMIRIGCIGDSITAGVGSTDSKYFAYPAQLARYLWKDALVFNYGNSGKTMRNDLADAYNKTEEYRACLNNAAHLDIITIMLGTNDSNRDRSWSAADDASFNQSCEALVNAMYDKNEDLRFVLCTCPTYFGADGFASMRVVSLVKKLVPTLQEKEYTVDLFDMRSVTSGMKDLYPDTLHPNNQGHMEMANAFAASLQTMIDAIQQKSVIEVQ